MGWGTGKGKDGRGEGRGEERQGKERESGEKEHRLWLASEKGCVCVCCQSGDGSVHNVVRMRTAIGNSQRVADADVEENCARDGTFASRCCMGRANNGGMRRA